MEFCFIISNIICDWLLFCFLESDNYGKVSNIVKLLWSLNWSEKTKEILWVSFAVSNDRIDCCKTRWIGSTLYSLFEILTIDWKDSNSSFSSPGLLGSSFYNNGWWWWFFNKRIKCHSWFRSSFYAADGNWHWQWQTDHLLSGPLLDNIVAPWLWSIPVQFSRLSLYPSSTPWTNQSADERSSSTANRG